MANDILKKNGVEMEMKKEAVLEASKIMEQQDSKNYVTSKCVWNYIKKLDISIDPDIVEYKETGTKHPTYCTR